MSKSIRPAQMSNKNINEGSKNTTPKTPNDQKQASKNGTRSKNQRQTKTTSNSRQSNKDKAQSEKQSTNSTKGKKNNNNNVKGVSANTKDKKTNGKQNNSRVNEKVNNVAGKSQDKGSTKSQNKKLTTVTKKTVPGPKKLGNIPGSFFTNSEILTIIRKDIASGEVCTEQCATKYLESNYNTYYILCTLWANMFIDVRVDLAHQLKYYLLDCGLVAAIANAKEYSLRVINQSNTVDTYDCWLIWPTLATVLSTMYPRVDDSVRRMLQLLRFPSRFSPDNADVVRNKGLMAFYKLESENKMKNNVDYSGIYIINDIRAIIHEILGDTRPDFSNGRFSNGSSNIFIEHGGKAYTMNTKVRGLKYLESLMDSDIVPLEYRSLDVVPVVPETSGKTVSVIQPVPKSYKTPRLIGMEDAHMGWKAQSLRKQLEDCLATSKYANCVHLHDQSYNQRLSTLGSATNQLATIDLSSASDSICLMLIEAVFPRNWYEAILEVRAENMRRPSGRVVRTEMFLTSGSPLTFIIETILFLSIDVAACHYAATFFPEKDVLLDTLLENIGVYGDDQIVPVWACETVINFLERLFFKVNKDKSYSDGPFRESCGSEAWNGVEVSTHYFPRFTYTWNAKEINANYTSLIELQHYLIGASFLNGAFLGSCIQQLYPGVTTSPMGAPTMDVWRDGVSYNKSDRIVMRQGTTLVSDPNQPVIKSTGITVAYEPIPESSLMGWTRDELKAQFELLLYMEFLKEGPQYEDPLMELLGCSSARKHNTISGTPVIKLVDKWIALS